MLSRRRRVALVKALAGPARSFVLVIAAAALIATMVRGGARYFFCPPMQAVMDAPCCGADANHAADGEDADDASSVRAPDCCQERRYGTLPAFAGASAAAPPPMSAVVAVLPATDLSLSVGFVPVRARVAHPVRAGPPRYASERRAELMVFHS